MECSVSSFFLATACLKEFTLNNKPEFIVCEEAAPKDFYIDAALTNQLITLLQENLSGTNGVLMIFV